MQVLVQRARGKVDRATVYRTVELFERLGIVHRLNIGWKYKIELTDVFTGHHHHFYCTNCGRMFDVPENPMLETMIETVAAKTAFSPRGHQLEIYGLCPNCSKA
jgi:Fur family ferric uptake transcriptional regulator